MKGNSLPVCFKKARGVGGRARWALLKIILYNRNNISLYVPILHVFVEQGMEVCMYIFISILS